MSLLEVRGLTRRFGDVAAVDGIDLSLDPGTIMGFVGPNGAGKTTTMRIIATLDAADAGEIRLDGRSLAEEPDALRPLIGFMPDRSSTYDDMTVWEYLDFFARAYRLVGAARRERVAHVMDFTGVAGMRDRLCTALSKGMKQRLALGRTLLHDPKLLVLDEPADGLDPRARIELRQMLKQLAAQGKAILISSHILTELSEICDTCAIIEQGRLLAAGPVSAVAEGSLGVSGSEIVVRLVSPPGRGPDVAAAERFLLGQESVAGVVVQGAELAVRLVAEKADADPGGIEIRAARLFEALARSGLPICSFHLRRVDLEDAFMSVTKGRVS